jgi:hypothetical protein
MTRLKTTLLAVSLLTASPAFAQTDVSGDWDITVNSPQGANTTPATFKQEGDKLTGMFKSPQGTLPFDSGSVTGSEVKFIFTITTQGMTLPITLSGRVEGETMAGKADFGGFAEGDWSAKRANAATTTAAASPAAATTAPAAAASAPTASAATAIGFGGKWDVMMKTPAGDMPANATLSDENGKLSGTFGSQLGEVPVSGTSEGKALKLTLVAQTPQGDMTVILTGDLDGDNIVNGKADVSGLGQMEWSAKRIKQ